MPLPDQQENKFPYTLEQIRKICGIDSIHTARKYLHEVLPPDYEKQGHGIGARYSENTLNSFRFVMKVKNSQDSKEKMKDALKLGQIRKVMEELGQDQINRIVRDKEPIHIHFVIKGKDGQISLPKDIESALTKQSALLISGNNVKTINEIDELEVPNPMQEEVCHSPGLKNWNTYPVSKCLEVRYKGELSEEKLDELEVVSRILKSIVEG